MQTKYSSVPLLPQGTYVLQDNKFCLLTQLSNGKQYLDQAPKVNLQFLLHTAIIDLSETQQCFILNVQKKKKSSSFVCFLLQYLAFSCGVVRGGLSNLGLDSVVTAEVSTMPSCKSKTHAIVIRLVIQNGFLKSRLLIQITSVL